MEATDGAQARALAFLEHAKGLFLEGDIQGYREALRLANETAEGESLAGETALVEALVLWRDPDALVPALQNAERLLAGRRSRMSVTPLALGFDSPLGLFHLKPGTATETQKTLETAETIYNRITGYATGTARLYGAQIAYHRGSFAEAKRSAYGVLYTTEASRQPFLMASALKLLLFISVNRMDMDEWAFALRKLNAFSCTETVEGLAPLCRLLRDDLLNAIGAPAHTPEWIRDGSFGAYRGESSFGFGYRVSGDWPGFRSYPMALVDHALYLLLSRQYERLLATDELHTLFRLDTIIEIDAYFHIFRAGGLYGLGDEKGALRALEGAFELLLPDGFYLIPALFVAFLKPLYAKLLKGRDDLAYQSILTLGESFTASREKLNRTVQGNQLPDTLTNAERKVAELVAQGRRNREVAQALGITERTVKNHLTSVFQKMDIDSRARLVRMLREVD